MQSRLQDSATEVRLGTVDIVVISHGRRPQSIRALRQNRSPARSSNRVVGSLATPNGLNFVRWLENFDLAPHPGDRRQGHAVLDREHADRRWDGTWISAGDPSCAIHQDAPPTFGAGSDAVQPAAGDRRNAFAIGVARAIPAGI